MKKLLQINPVLRTSTSTGRIVREIGETAMSNGWESYIAYSRGRDGLMECTSQTIPVGNRTSVALHGLATRLADRHGLASDHATVAFIRRIEEIQPDIIHIHNIHGYFLNYRILFDYLSRCNTPVVWTVHDCWLYTGHCYYYSSAGCDRWQSGCGQCPQRGEFPRSLLVDRSAQNWKDKKAAFTSLPQDRLIIVPVSEWLRDEMSHSFLSGCRFKVIHNGIDTDTFSPAAAKPKASVAKPKTTAAKPEATIKTKYNIPRDKHIILGVASIWSKEKGLDDFIALSGKLREDEVIVLVGVSKEQAASLPGGIIGITRTDNVHELAQLYSAAHVFANFTLQDNYPTVNLEAISCGTPVVTYRTGGSPESVTEGKTGYIVPQGDLDTALDRIREAENGDFTEACREYALANFRKQDRYQDYLSLYNSLLTK